MVELVLVVGLELLVVLVAVGSGAGPGLVVEAVVAVPDLVEWLGGSSCWSGCVCSIVLLIDHQRVSALLIGPVMV